MLRQRAFLTPFVRGSLRWLLVGLLCGGVVAPLQALEQVRLQLNWQHQFEFAGFYAAQAKGYYRDAGLEVAILPAKPGDKPEQVVVDGGAEFGVSDAGLLLRRSRNEPVVVLAVIFQHSPAVLLVPENGVKSIAELRGKRVMMHAPHPELDAYFRAEGLAENAFTRVEPSYNPQDLISGRVDAMQAYASDEPEYLNRADFPFRTFSARDAGIDFYDLNLFTTQGLIERNPQMVKAFREASLRGWQYAMEHPDEIMNVLSREYSQKHTREHLRFQYQQMVPLIQPVLVEMGYMNPDRWQRIAQTYTELGMLPSNFSLDGFIYDANPASTPLWLYLGLLLALVLLLIISLVALRFVRLSTRLRREVTMRGELQQELQTQVQMDYLTGLASRRYFMERAQTELQRAQRYGLSLSLCMLDIDFFKKINDGHGHKAGDLVLQRFSEICRAALREIDLAGRLGGEEFALLLPETDLQEARVVAERLRVSFTNARLSSEFGRSLQFTVSIGVAQLTGADETLDSLLGRADRGLYLAKSAGRNRVCVSDS